VRRHRSRYWIASVGIGCISVATLTVAGISAAIGGTSSDAKQQAVKHPHTLASLPAGSGTYVLQHPKAKLSGGRAADATAEQTDAITRSIGLLRAYCQLQALPDDVAQRPAAIAAGQQARADSMRGIWSSDVVDDRLTELTNAVNLVADDQTYQAYSDCTIVADQSTATATIDGLTAAVVLTAHASYRDGDLTKDDPDTQWQVGLVRPSTTQDWLLETVGQVSLSGSDS
jgi:hypothetical protein